MSVWLLIPEILVFGFIISLIIHDFVTTQNARSTWWSELLIGAILGTTVFLICIGAWLVLNYEPVQSSSLL